MRVFPWELFFGLRQRSGLARPVAAGALDLMCPCVAFPIAVLNVALSYLPSHEAQHNIIARKGHRLRWLNELLGWVSLIPLWQSFQVMRFTHYEHHRHE